MLNDQKMENNPMGAPLPEPFTVNQSQMSPSPAVLRGFWRLFADAWHSYWPHFWTFVKINLLLVILILVPILAVTSVVILRLAGMSAIIIGVILGIILLAIVILFIIRLLVANVVLTCRVAAGKEVIAVSQLLKIARHNVGKIIGVAILVGLAVIIGQILFVIPGLIFMTWFALPMFVVVFEDLGVIKSMSRSYNLVQGYGWETFYLIAGITLLTGLLSSLVQIIGIAGFAFGSVGGMMMGGESTGLIVGFGVAILSALFFACLISLLTPIWGIMPALRYLDLKHIKDNNLPKTESTAKAVTISLILVLIWVPLIAFGMWGQYKELTGKKDALNSNSMPDIPANNWPEIQPQEKSFEEQIRARDTIRKNDLRQLKTALDNYYQDNGRYPIESGSPGPVPMPQLSKYTSLDNSSRPIGEFLYLYLSNSDGQKFTLFAKLENPNDKDIKTSGPTPDIPLPEGYNYWITSD